jgi:hypothetical protein
MGNLHPDIDPQQFIPPAPVLELPAMAFLDRFSVYHCPAIFTAVRMVSLIIPAKGGFYLSEISEPLKSSIANMT